MQVLDPDIRKLAKLQTRFREDPEFFHSEVLGYRPWDRQLEISDSITKHRNTAVRSCNGAGKTFHVAREGIRFLFSYYPSLVINTAPIWTQVENQYWRYFRDAYQKAAYPLGGALLKTRLDLADDWYAIGLANDENKMESFQGWHAENILVIFDESSGISPKIHEAAIGAMAGGTVVRFVQIGNATQNAGPFHAAFSDPGYNKIKITAYDVPNVKERRQVIPGLVTHEWVEELAKKYGEDSDIFRVRALAEFPRHAQDTLISLDLITGAFDPGRELLNQKDEIIGFDPGAGGDPSAFVYRRGNFAKVLEVTEEPDVMKTTGKAARYLREYKTARMMIDIVGLGIGPYHRLKEQPDIAGRVFGVNSALPARDPVNFINVRVESWVNVRDWLRDAVLEKHEGFYELAHPKYKFTSAGKMQLESKEDMAKRGVASPNVGDALALTLSRATKGDNVGLMWI